MRLVEEPVGVLKEKFDGEQEVADKELGRVADEGPGTDADKEGPGRDGGREPVSPARVTEEEEGRFGGDEARDLAEVG